MLIAHVVLVIIAVGTVAVWPRSAPATVAIIALAVADVALGGGTGPVLGVVGPLVLFLSAALSLARVVESSGLGERVALALASVAHGNTWMLYGTVCLLCAALTATVSLDGAVVLMVPLLSMLAERFGAPIRPLFLGVIAVANAASIALPQGNPTNLVVIQRLALSPAAFTARMLLPGVAAAIMFAVAIAVTERRALATTHTAPRRRERTPLSRAELRAGLALAGAAIAAWAAPFIGVAPWWPFSGVVAIALIGRRPPVTVPWRIALQLCALLVIVGGLGLTPPAVTPGLPGLLAVAGAVSAIAALANNLPASVSAGTLLAGGTGYAASIGLAIGSLALPQGSVATLIATDLAGDSAPSFPAARFALTAAIVVAVVTVMVWAGL
jgi:arsenical pump membrane protein